MICGGGYVVRWVSSATKYEKRKIRKTERGGLGVYILPDDVRVAKGGFFTCGSLKKSGGDV